MADLWVKQERERQRKKDRLANVLLVVLTVVWCAACLLTMPWGLLLLILGNFLFRPLYFGLLKLFGLLPARRVPTAAATSRPATQPAVYPEEGNGGDEFFEKQQQEWAMMAKSDPIAIASGLDKWL